MSLDPMKLPRAAEWKSDFGGGPGLYDYIAQKGGATLAFAFAALFWPTFVERDGCVLLRERYHEDGFASWWEKLDGDCPAIEAMLNHIHLWDLLNPDAEDIPDEAVHELAQILAKTWQSALADQFPDRSFVVTVSDDDEDYGPTITVRSIASTP